MNESDMIKIFLGMGGFVLTLGIIGYVFTSISYMKIFKSYNYAHPGYAFIPLYNLYILADLTCKDHFKIGEFRVEKKYFVWWWLIAIVIGFIPVLGKFIQFVIIIVAEGYCRKVAFTKLDRKYSDSIIAYISVIIPIVMWFIVIPSKKIYYNDSDE